MPKRTFLVAITAALIAASASGCGSDDKPSGPSCTDGVLNGTEEGVDCGGSCAACLGDWTQVVWDQAGGGHLPYEQYVFVCPAHGAIETIWGSDIYTDDSSVCTAALHAGIITGTTEQSVTIEIWPGQAGYAGTTRHGVTSNSYTYWEYSYVFVPVSASIPKCTANGLQNGTESGVDCGRDCATKCPTGEVCFGDQDCASGTCDGGTLTCD